jgi:hypothetical protein
MHIFEFFSFYSNKSNKPFKLYYPPATFPRSLRLNCDIYHIVGPSFVLPVDISPCPVLPAIMPQLLQPCDHGGAVV